MYHIVFHFLVPALIVSVFFHEKWLTAYLIMTATMLVDLDHLLAVPMYDISRCSIGFHPLHQVWMIVFYVVLTMFPKTRLVGLGLSVHMLLDSIDCQFTSGIWMQ